MADLALTAQVRHYSGLTYRESECGMWGKSASESTSSGPEGAIAVRFEPPAGVSPATASLLVDGKPSLKTVSAMIVDLAARGWFVIERDGERWALVSPTVLPPPHDVLSPSETLLVGMLFKPSLAELSGTDIRPQYVSLTSVKHRLASGLQTVLETLGQELVDSGLATRNVAKRAFGITGRSFRTSLGEEALKETQGFRLYVQRAERGQLVNDEAEGFLGGFAGYAVAFGLIDKWTDAMGAHGAESSHLNSPAGQLLSTLHTNPRLLGAAMAASSSGSLNLDNLFVLTAVGRQVRTPRP